MRTVACVHGPSVNSQGNPLEFSVSIVMLELETIQAALFLRMVVAPCLNLKPHPDLCMLKKKMKKKKMSSTESLMQHFNIPRQRFPGTWNPLHLAGT